MDVVICMINGALAPPLAPDVDVDAPAARLPAELLSKILERVELPDRFAVAGVCSAWRAAALHFAPPASAPLALTIIGDERSGKPRRVAELSSLADDREGKHRALPVSSAAALLRRLPPPLRDSAGEVRLTFFFLRNVRTFPYLEADREVLGLPAAEVVASLPASVASLALRLSPATPLGQMIEGGKFLKALGPFLLQRLPRLSTLSFLTVSPSNPHKLGHCTTDELPALPCLASLRGCLIMEKVASPLSALDSWPALRRVSTLDVPPQALADFARRGIRCRSLRLYLYTPRRFDLTDPANLCAVLRPAEFAPEDGTAQLFLRACNLPSALPAGSLSGLESLLLRGQIGNVAGLGSFWGIRSLKEVMLRDASIFPTTPETADELLAALEAAPAGLSVAFETAQRDHAWPAAVMARFLRRLAACPRLLQQVSVDIDRRFWRKSDAECRAAFDAFDAAVRALVADEASQTCDQQL